MGSVSDGYQRVMRIIQDRSSSAGDQLLRDDEHGPLKVVPADAIVIERGDLPEVVVDGAERQLVHAGHVERHRTTDPADVRANGLMILALAEHLAAHPPVDEAQVSALAEVVAAIGGPPLGGGTTPLAEDFARRLVERGVRIDTTEEPAR